MGTSTQFVSAEAIVWSFDALPFHVGPVSEPHNPHGSPDTILLTLLWDPVLQRLCHKPAVEVVAWIETAYRKGFHIGTPLDEKGMGRKYADNFMRFIGESIGWLPGLKRLRALV